MVLDALPLNANGKIDCKQLPQAQYGAEASYEAPQGELEQALAGILVAGAGVAAGAGRPAQQLL